MTRTTDSVTDGSTTNLKGGAAGQVPYQQSTSKTVFTNALNGVLISNGTTPSFTAILDEARGGTGVTSLATVTVGKATNLAGGSNGQVPYQNGVGSTAFLSSTPNSLMFHDGVNPSFATNVFLDGRITFTPTTNINPVKMTTGTLAFNIGVEMRNLAANTESYIYLNGGAAGKTSIRHASGGTPWEITLASGGIVGLPAAAYTSADFLSTDASGNITTKSIASAVVGRANHITGGLAGQVAYQTAVNTTAFTNAAAGVLTSNGTTPSFSPIVTLTDGSITVTSSTVAPVTLGTFKTTTAGGTPIITLENTANVYKLQGGLSALVAELPVGRGFQILQSTTNNVLFNVNTSGTINTTYISSPFLTTNGSGAIVAGSVLGVANGGTGQSSLASVTVGKATSLDGGSNGQVPYQNGVGSTAFLSGIANSLMAHNGTVPSFSTDVLLDGRITLAPATNIHPVKMTTSTLANNIGVEIRNLVATTESVFYLNGGAAGKTSIRHAIGGTPWEITLASGGIVALPPAAYTSADFLSTNASGDITTKSIASAVVGRANNITGGLAGQVAYQTAVNTTAFTNAAAGVLTSDGTTPSFSPVVTLAEGSVTATSSTLAPVTLGTFKTTTAGGTPIITLENTANVYKLQGGLSALVAELPVGRGFQILQSTTNNVLFNVNTSGTINTTYISSPFLTTNGSGAIVAGSVLGVANGGTGSTGPISTAITLSRSAGGTLDSISYAFNVIFYQTIGGFITVTIRMTTTITTTGGVFLQFDLPFTYTGGPIVFPQIWDELGNTLYQGKILDGSNKMLILDSSMGTTTFSTGTHSFECTFQMKV